MSTKLWPMPMFHDCLPANMSRQVDGVTASGTPWIYSEIKSKYMENDDEDTNEFRLGELYICYEDVFALGDFDKTLTQVSDTRKIVKYKGNTVYSWSKNGDLAQEGGLATALEAIATAEGVTVAELVAALPIAVALPPPPPPFIATAFTTRAAYEAWLRAGADAAALPEEPSASPPSPQQNRAFEASPPASPLADPHPEPSPIGSCNTAYWLCFRTPTTAEAASRGRSEQEETIRRLEASNRKLEQRMAMLEGREGRVTGR